MRFNTSLTPQLNPPYPLRPHYKKLSFATKTFILKKFLAFLNFIPNTLLEQKPNFYLENLW
ncbi:hypothetical protein BB460_03750 [Helicobacter pylori]|nr:hypothetical protein BB460_03750 [Helicobacter pylori]